MTNTPMQPRLVTCRYDYDGYYDAFIHEADNRLKKRAEHGQPL